MTSDGGVPSGCSVVDGELVAAYGAGTLGDIAAWSVEQHLPGCAACRSVLAGELDRARLERNLTVVLTRIGLPEPGPVERVAARLGVPSHLWRLLVVTPSLRASWLAGTVLVLAAAVGAAWADRSWLAGGAAGLVPFLVLAPLLPLAAIGAAFCRAFDPAADLATAAPVSGVWLFLVRSAAVLPSALGPVVVAACVLPGDPLLPLLVVLPALALVAAALALATLTDPARAAGCVAGGWVVLVVALGLASGSPAAPYSRSGQAVEVCVALTACALLWARRHVLEAGWNRQ
jgi:hypothetical protein